MIGCEGCPLCESSDLGMLICSPCNQYTESVESCPLNVDTSVPLSVRIRAYVAMHPGTTFRAICAHVLDFHHEKSSDAERIIALLVSHGQLSTVSREDAFFGRAFVSYYIPEVAE